MNSVNYAFLAGLLAATSLSAQTPGGDWVSLGQVEGSAWDHGYGGAVAVVEDIDGDGFPEVVQGSFLHEDGSGQNIGLLQMRSGKTGSLLWEYVPSAPAPYPYSPVTGSRIAPVPDLDSDGIEDILIGNGAYDASRGRVEVLSGVDGSLIRVHDGAWHGPLAGGDVLGNAILGVADLSGDGLGDYLISSHGGNDSWGNQSVGFVDCFSGADGQLIWRRYGMNEWDHFGSAITSTSDFDGDSMPDFLIGTGEEYQGIAGQGRVHVISAVLGQTIMTFPPLVSDQSQIYGGSLTTLPDIDGDQLEELVIGAPGFGSGSTYAAGAVEARLSGSGTVIWRVEGSVQFGRFGAKLHRVPDLDQDGYPEIVVFQELLNTTDDPRLIVLSGQDGRILWEFKGVSPYSGFGIGMGAFDRNGDGLPELFVGEPYYGVGWLGRVVVLSLTPFLSNEGVLSHSAAGSGELRFQLDFPSTEAGLPFAALASSSGPGSFNHGGVGIPLTMDATLQQVYRNPPPSFRGTLDGDGDHLVVTRLPAGSLSSFVGTTLHFAAVTLVGGQPSLSSVAVPIEVLP